MAKPRKSPQLYELPSSTVVLGPALVWVGLLGLLAVNIGVSFLPLGPAKTPVNLAVAVVQASLMFVVFMRLNRASALVKLTAAAGLVWLSFLFLIGSADFLTRPLISP
ncbi:cytochrome C oxidase subunit IV family protein [Caulobacter sp. S45]|uniref:cytochrome C oxidase subunit IV family protein n=1 Tax=Caulobacter sp. S45 TaxID=1641861 RepID=UPI001576F6DD|nr:cytochrome C oxidase subunit IV family protein [Caulobacter sp. S45]